MSDKYYIGGEHILNPGIFFKSEVFDINGLIKKKYSNYNNFYLTLGGIHSFGEIMTFLALKDNEHILLPSYLCPDIIDYLKKKKIKYYFYKIKKNLKIDFDDLLSKINIHTKAILYINYFGFPVIGDNEKFFMNSIRSKNITLIEDAVHSFYSDYENYGDFIFNSFRKFLPADAGIILTNRNLIQREQIYFNNYLIFRTLSRFFRFAKFKLKFIPDWLFLNFLEISEKKYHNTDNNPSKISLFILNRINHYEIINNLRKNFKELAKIFFDISLFKECDAGVVPLGFPIIVKNRNAIINKLKENNIFCPVHWRLNNEIDKNEFSESWAISENIITIPLNFNSSRKLNYLISKIKNYI